jgi:Domain of unknown function (DUF4258)
MLRKYSRAIQLLLLILVVGVGLFQWFQKTPQNGAACEFQNRIAATELDYSKHARCRMKCRDIDQDLVEDVYRNGSLNCDKSDPGGTKDGSPRYALELEDGGRGRVRIIVADNDGTHVIVTVIRLDEKDQCACH